MNVNRLLKTALITLPCAVLLTLGCSEPETIPGGAQNMERPGAPAGNPGPPSGAPVGEPNTDGGGEAGAPDGGAAPPAAGAPGSKGPADAPGQDPAASGDGAVVVGDPVPNAEGDVPQRADAPGELFQGDISKHPCGDGECDEAESQDPKLCPRDCSDEKPPGGDWCGDGICDAREQAAKNCAKDCGSD